MRHKYLREPNKYKFRKALGFLILVQLIDSENQFILPNFRKHDLV